MGLVELTLDEKFDLVTGKGMWHTNDCNGKLPSIHMSDGPHGLRKQEENVLTNNDSKVSTCFPTASAIACSWDEDAASEMAAAIADEAYDENISIILGPGVNIKRSPLCGRNFEYFSEDPFLAGKLGAAYVNAAQAHGVGTSLKHFAGNSQETHRQTANSQIDERALREIYLSAFEYVVKNAAPATIMASYNRLNGDYSCENSYLLTDILRKEWGYKGAVISDWGACVDLAKSLICGMDLEMPDSVGIHRKKLVNDYKNGLITDAQINAAVDRIEELVLKYSAVNRIKRGVDLKQHHIIAKDLEVRSAVLLKNDGVLPLLKGDSVNVIGELARTMRFQGGGSSHINTVTTPNALQSLNSVGITTEFAPGYKVTDNGVSRELEDEAVKLAKNGKPILFFGGLTDLAEGEGYDRNTLVLPSNQISLLQKIYQVNENIVFVSFGGAPFDMNFESKTRAILHMYLGGQAVGEACADLLVGIANPSGKLAETFPMSISDIPCNETFATGSDDVEYRESLFVGYRYYDTYDISVRYPFGYGLSYTTFEYSNLKLSSNTYGGGKLTVTFDITNTGKYAGAEVAQLYIKNPKCNYLRAVKELRGFKKVFLEAGTTKTVSIELDYRSFSIYDIDMKSFVMPSGQYEIIVGTSSKNEELIKVVNVEGMRYELDNRKKYSEYFVKSNNRLKVSHNQFQSIYGKETSHFDELSRGNFSVYNSLSQLATKSIFGRIVLFAVKYVAYGMFKGKPHDDPEVMMMIEGIKDGTIDSVICQSGGMVPYKLAESIVLSANGHKFKAFVRLLGFTQ